MAESMLPCYNKCLASRIFLDKASPVRPGPGQGHGEVQGDVSDIGGHDGESVL